MKKLITIKNQIFNNFLNPLCSSIIDAAIFLNIILNKEGNKMQNQIYKLSFPKTLFVFLFLFLTAHTSNGQMLKHYDTFCGATGQDYGRSIINRIDSGYAIAGYSYHSPACIGTYDWMFLKLKPNGNVDCAKILGLTNDDKCFSLIQSYNDSGYVLAGYTSNTLSPFKKKATMTKLNKNCNLMYSRCINDTLNSAYNQVTKEPTNNWAFAGYEEHQITVGYVRNKILISRYSQFGALLWAYKYGAGGLSTEEAQSICFQPVSGTYGVAARTNYYSGVAGTYDIMLMKVDLAGNVIWRKVYKFVLPTAVSYPNSEPRKIIPMADGGFVVAGFTNAYGSTQRDILVLRVSASGGIMWSSVYGSTAYYEQGESVILDGANLVVTGSQRVFSPLGPPNAFMLKIPAAGGGAMFYRVWDNTNPTDVGYDLVNTAAGGAVGYGVTGQTTRGVLLNDAFLWRTNTSGLIPGSTCNDSLSIPRTGNTHKLDSFAISRNQVFDITRPCTVVDPTTTTTILCTSNNSPEGENQTDDANKFSLKQNSPNPFNPTTVINYVLPVSGFTSIKVYDVSGRMVSLLVDEFKESGIHKVTFDGSNLSTGVYYYKIQSGNFTDIKKMILIK